MKKIFIILLLLASTQQAYSMRRSIRRLPKHQATTTMQLSQLFMQRKYNEAFLLARSNNKLNMKDTERYLLRKHLESDAEQSNERVKDSNSIIRNFWVTLPLFVGFLVEPVISSNLLLGVAGTFGGISSIIHKLSYQYDKNHHQSLINKLETFDLIFKNTKEQELKTK